MKEDPNHLVGPVKRSDVVAVACFALAAYSLISSTWPVVACFAIAGGILAGLSPRMEGRWGLHAGNVHAGGQFIPVRAESIRIERATSQSQLQEPQEPTPQPELPPSRQSGSD